MHRTGSIKLIQTRTKRRSNAFLHAWFVLGFNSTVTLIITFSTIAGAHTEKKKLKTFFNRTWILPRPVFIFQLFSKQLIQ